MSRLARAEALRTEIDAACASLDHVLVTLDPREAKAGYTYGVVVIVPPELTFTSWYETEETWTLHIAAGPWDDLGAAWDTIDAIITALRAAHINLASGEPTPIQVLDREPPWPGYVLTLEPDPIHDI